ncbi:hypothetical protein C3747_61g179 [Trypanosoma cruzi]|uniref:Uncharacterized protein n=2 Tax=Trypanosoma cruzi TaxID=5693 RepID=Q4DBL4_TRYCC|nr:hypothetical protein, conserved [Trypanosoma cruzi]EAN89917.1 hypothetical protein, conserved [Trypanosoma cruzi]PWV11270.1 hypothetical protein C3747_61g179 [Trypanosoma cruzi]|eukprot:XP_811768.1 hypothetical protein [Trypanosoma cruzi strain CL Brener]
MGYRREVIVKSSWSNTTPTERRKRGRPDQSRPAPPNPWRAATHNGSSPQETTHVSPTVFGAPDSSGTFPPERSNVRYGHTADGSGRSRQVETEKEKKLAPTHSTEQPSKENEKIKHTVDTEKAKIADQRPPTAEGGCSHASLQELLRRIIALEFSGRCTQRSMAVLETICDTLCQTPMAVVKVMEVLDECFAEAVNMRQQQQLLNYWYIVDAVMKLFRDRPSMLNAVVVALPHLLLQYVPWKKSRLAEEPWVQRESDGHRYEQLFLTWGRAVPKPLLDEIWSLWKNGAPQTETNSLNKP